MTKSVVPEPKTATCPMCGPVGYFIRSVKPNGMPYHIFKCSLCRLEFCHPMPTENILSEFYRDYKNVRADDHVLRKNGKRNFECLKQYGLSFDSRLLDFGSGKGLFQDIGGKNWFNYDPYFENDEAVLKSGYYDWVTLWDVLEHVVNPIDTMKQVNECLKLRGYIALITVSVETSIPFRYKPPEHVTYWTRDAIRICLDRTGFELIEYQNYEMDQLSRVYMNAILRTVPDKYRNRISNNLPEMVTVPTNEVFVIAQKTD